jgi:ATP-dependent DNA helicase RecG
MRSDLLAPVLADLTALKGVGAQTGARLNRLVSAAGDSARIIDLLFHLPHAAIDRRSRTCIAAAQEANLATFEVIVVSHHKPPSWRLGMPYRIRVADATGELDLVFFAATAWIGGTLPIGARRLVCGRPYRRDGHLQIVHPERILDPADPAALVNVEPVYRMTEGLRAPGLGRLMRQALARLPTLPEWQREATDATPGFAEALQRIHCPSDPGEIDAGAPPAQRLALDELLAHQLALALQHRTLRRRTLARAPSVRPGLVDRLGACLPFRLTASQRQAVEEICFDLALPQRMLRLLIGDVGSGKTMVALLAMTAAVETGAQAALMVPSEILAQQHYRRLRPLAEAIGLRVGLFTGRMTQPDRRVALGDLRAGRIDLVFGTHALLEEPVKFKRLGLAVIDEQHRFGVAQRLRLAKKGDEADLLLMTATPIPRTFVLAAFGDIAVSQLTEKPAGRATIATRAMPAERLPEVVAAVGRAFAAGARTFWICPLIDDDVDGERAAAQARYAALQARFGSAVGLLHGQMSGAEQVEAMRRFSEGSCAILVATSVVEVGIDIEQASVMVIEDAERFGLAQLHQLRGRIGRGERASTCLLVYRSPLSDLARTRLDVLRSSDDGFLIAEADARLRGGGDAIGTRQSGAPEFRLADLAVHAELVASAQAEARWIIAADPHLRSARGQALRLLLTLFGHEDALALAG